MDQKNILEAFGLPSTVVGSPEWEELEKKEFSMGNEALLEEIIAKKLWTNVEMVWIIKQLIYYYGKKDELLKKAPIERIFTNMSDVLRVFLLILDITDPELEDNLRSYLSSKLVDATWGINRRTRVYLAKMQEN